MDLAAPMFEKRLSLLQYSLGDYLKSCHALSCLMPEPRARKLMIQLENVHLTFHMWFNLQKSLVQNVSLLAENVPCWHCCELVLIILILGFVLCKKLIITDPQNKTMVVLLPVLHVFYT